MPILEAHHDLAHPVEGDTAWSESYYFNAYDPGTDSGFFSRIGIRPNEGTMDAAMSIWLPGGDLAEYRAVKEQREMVDSVLAVGDVTYEMLEAGRSWRLTMDGEARRRPCRTGTEKKGEGPPAGTEPRTVRLALDVRFDAVTPAIGVDGQRAGGAGSAQAAASELDIRIEELGLTERSRNCLKRAGINTIAQLVNATERDLTSITNFGATSLKDVNDRLEERGLSLRAED